MYGLKLSAILVAVSLIAGAKGSAGPTEVTTLSASQAKKLIDAEPVVLYLTEVASISPDVAAALAKHDGIAVYLTGLT